MTGADKLNTLKTWDAGEPCAKHELAYCVTCREQAHIKRFDGKLQFEGSCVVTAFAHLTGVEYAEAAELMAAAGQTLGEGTKATTAQTALETAGFGWRPSSLTLMEAMAASQSGRRFYVSARRGTRGHAWAIVDGAAYGPWRDGFRYRIFEVTP